MKKEVLCLALASVMSTSAVADETFCNGIGEFARLVMEKRQSGVPMQELYSKFDDHQNSTQADLARKVIAMAYEEPLFYGDQLRSATVTEFQNKIFRSCLQ